MFEVVQFVFYGKEKCSYNGELQIEDIYETSDPYRKDGSFRSIFRHKIKKHLKQGKKIEIIALGEDL